MRILCLNANTTAYVTRTVADEMASTLCNRAHVIPVTPEDGPPIIRSAEDNALAHQGVLTAAHEHMNNADAIMLAVSFDTALTELRGSLSIPVVGMTEASISLARLCGGPLGFITLGASLVPLYEETLTHCDLKTDCVGWRAFDAPSAYREGDKTELDRLLLAATAELATDGARTVVLLGAVLAGAARRIAPRTKTRVIDGGNAGALIAEALLNLP
ncbi:aspartate/glutamate racemase family protein [Algicella marina]|uniref:Hydantoin racemase n=1 Tax=Algicella marina TaxID=2683284 RepID=A0A6P1SX79_9RHOB|nr:aspartate/glutamate racemase family protein [Algicella marina]QHQ34367.1 hypothetical protein GO499_03790 [Algicella marina]